MCAIVKCGTQLIRHTVEHGAQGQPEVVLYRRESTLCRRVFYQLNL